MIAKFSSFAGRVRVFFAASQYWDK